MKFLQNENTQSIIKLVGVFSLCLTTVSVISLSKSLKDISNDLEPLSTWADSQNECILKTFRIDGKDTQGMPSKVWSCNGGGD